ncbi:MAG: type VI secretion system baseplate subunit TssF [Fibrobacteria bacterium]|nr:type VI secretion system baseplate subunit TssF [Fibrobacteria bacterium]
MSDLKRYFDEEMRYLLEEGRRFARRYPETARALSIDEVEDRHPYLERLFQGFAFIAARIRQDLDGEEDQIADGLLDRLLPGLEVPLSSCSIAQFQPKAEVLEPLLVPAGASVRSRPIASLGRELQFFLSQETVVHPAVLSEARLDFQDAGAGELHLSLTGSTKDAVLDLSRPFDLFLGGDTSSAWCLHHWLCRRVERVECSFDNAPFKTCGAGISPLRLSANGGRPGGSEMQSSLLELRDFLCIDEISRMVRLRVAENGTCRNLRVRFFFSGIPPRNLATYVSPSTVHLNVGLVRNETLRPCQNIPLDSDWGDFPLQPTQDSGEEIIDLFDLEGVSAADPTKRRGYERFEGFMGVTGAPPRCSFRLHRRTNRSGALRCSIHVERPMDAEFQDEYLRPVAVSCDGNLPREHLKAGDLSLAGTGIPGGIQCRALMDPTSIYRPLELAESRWQLLGSLQRSLRGLLDPKGLRSLLAGLAWDPRGGRRALVENIASIRSGLLHEMEEGVHRPVCRIEIEYGDPALAEDSWEQFGLLDVFARHLCRLFRSQLPEDTGLRLSLRVSNLDLSLEHQA